MELSGNIAYMSTSLTQLGRKAEPAKSPDLAHIECVANTLTRPFTSRFIIPEFTSVCPVTGQPDFAGIVIDYVPAAWLIESKSLKLFIASFRQYAAFHEDVTGLIGERLFKAAAPCWIRVKTFFNHRGGIAIDCTFTAGQFPSRDCEFPVARFADIRK